MDGGTAGDHAAGRSRLRLTRRNDAQMIHLRRRAVGAALLGLILLLPALAGPATAAGPRSERDRILAYWTAERIAAAKPRDMTLVGGRFVVGKMAAPAPQPLAAPANTTGSQWPDDVGK